MITDEDMTGGRAGLGPTLLESGYRRVLRLLPRGHRAAHGGEALRIVALVALLVPAAPALVWLVLAVRGLAGDAAGAGGGGAGSLVPLQAPAAWVLAYLALALGRREAALALAGLAFVVSALDLVVRFEVWEEPLPGVAAAALVLALPVVALALSAAPSWRPDRRAVSAGWVAALAPAAAAASVLGRPVLGPVPLVWDLPGLLCLAAVAAAATGLLAFLRGGAPGPWGAAVALLAGMAVLVRGATLADLLGHPGAVRGQELLVLSATVQEAVVLVVCAIGFVVARDAGATRG